MYVLRFTAKCESTRDFSSNLLQYRLVICLQKFIKLEPGLTKLLPKFILFHSV